MRLCSFPRTRFAIPLSLLALALGACDRGGEGETDVTVIGTNMEIADPSSGELSMPQTVLLPSVAQGLVGFDARGQIVPALAESWNVSADGLSYIFRISSGEWPNGEEIDAHQVARILRRQIAGGSGNPLKDALSAVSKVTAMTDRVIEIQLSAPRPDLLQLLAQPELAILREGAGTGPFRIAEQPEEEASPGRLLLERDVPVADEEEPRREEVTLGAAAAGEAVAQFKRGETDLVLGGTFSDLPVARAAGVSGDTLQFDPAVGLFGLMPARQNGPLKNEELRRLLSQALDRGALLATLDIPGLVPRTTLLEPGLEGLPDPAAPEWASVPLEQRRQDLAAAADEIFAGDQDRPVLRVALPEGPGADLLLQRLADDWAVLGIGVERAQQGEAADLRLIDAVAPSMSPAWFLRHFRCGQAPVCAEATDELLQAARATPVADQRSALLAEAARQMDDLQLFLPIAAPIRWSLVSNRVQGFARNRFARHPLIQLGDALNPERAE